MTRRLAIVAAVALAAALSIYTLRAEPPGPGTSRSPTPTAPATPTATPAAEASPLPTAGAASDRYGYVFIVSDRIEVRRERDGVEVFGLGGGGPAVSPDGRRLAYWRTLPSAPRRDLCVLEVADPTGARANTVVKLC